MQPRPHLALRSAVTGVVLLAVLSPGSAVGAADPSPVPAGSAVWPLSPVPEVVDPFDAPETRYGAGHRGVDLAGSPGQTVRAALGGTVTFAGMLAGRGVVVVDHGATRTTYEPVEATVDLADTVAAGDPIGRLQRGGSHCAPAVCLHWGLLAGADYRDPLTLVGAGPVRLLPLDGARPGAAAVVDAAAPEGRRFPRWDPEPVRNLLPRGDGALFRDRRPLRPAGVPGGTPGAAGRS